MYSLRSVLCSFSFALLGCLCASATCEAQLATLEFRIAFNNALGPSTLVEDNGPGDLNPAISAVTVDVAGTQNGMSLTGSILGFQIPPAAIGGLYGRRLLITGVVAEALPGTFALPAGRMEIFACYRFPGFLAVPPPNTFGKALDGYFADTMVPMTSVKFARVEYSSQRNAVFLGPGEPGAWVHFVADTCGVDPLIGCPFDPCCGMSSFSDFGAEGFFRDHCVSIGSYVECAVAYEGDAVVLPASASAEAVAGPIVSTQLCQTDFGNNLLELPTFADGSELDWARAVIDGGKLFLQLAGNLESNFNKLEIFLDTVSGGQNRLRGDNPDVDFDGLNRMGDDGSNNGLTFDGSFEPDYWISLTGGDTVPGVYRLYANYAELLSAGGGAGYYLGETGAVSDGVLSGGTNPYGIEATIDNTNIDGVTAGCGLDEAGPVVTGVWVAIPLEAIGNPTGPVRICAFVNGDEHDFVSNQFLAPLPWGSCNLGEPRLVDLANLSGEQWFQVQPDADPVFVDVRPTPAGRIRAWPNPFRQEITFAMDASGMPFDSAEVFDVTGRRVQTLRLGQAGTSHVRWDGSDENGHPVAAGYYVVRFRGAEGEEAVPVIRLR